MRKDWKRPVYKNKLQITADIALQTMTHRLLSEVTFYILMTVHK